MAHQNKPRITLDQPVLYQIRVPGHMDASWLDWLEAITVELDFDGAGSPVTILTGLFDQAALIGFLRRLYALGIPLISVACQEAA